MLLFLLLLEQKNHVTMLIHHILIPHGDCPSTLSDMFLQIRNAFLNLLENAKKTPSRQWLVGGKELYVVKVMLYFFYGFHQMVFTKKISQR